VRKGCEVPKYRDEDTKIARFMKLNDEDEKQLLEILHAIRCETCACYRHGCTRTTGPLDICQGFELPKAKQAAIRDATEDELAKLG
jgi:hypothetical protein